MDLKSSQGSLANIPEKLREFHNWDISIKNVLSWISLVNAVSWNDTPPQLQTKIPLIGKYMREELLCQISRSKLLDVIVHIASSVNQALRGFILVAFFWRTIESHYTISYQDSGSHTYTWWKGTPHNIIL